MLNFLAIPLLALPVLALNITFGGPPGPLGAPTGNLKVSQLLPVVPSLQTACATTCLPATTEIARCTDTSDACLCSTLIALLIQDCEQCMFLELIRTNKPMPDIRAGSNVALKAYGGACLAALNQTAVPAVSLAKNQAAQNISNVQVLSSLALFVPEATWDGPVSQPLGLPATIVVVALGGILGVGGITILNTM